MAADLPVVASWPIRRMQCVSGLHGIPLPCMDCGARQDEFKPDARIVCLTCHRVACTSCYRIWHVSRNCLEGRTTAAALDGPAAEVKPSPHLAD